MTPFENFIATYWWQIGSVLVLFIGGIYKVNSLQKAVDDHHSPMNPAPHPNLPCAAHKEMLEQIKETLERIDDRVFKIVKHNGYDKDHDE